MTPRYGAPPRPGVAYRRRPGAYAILLGTEEGGGVRLLLTRQVTGDVDEVQLPGGGIDAEESPGPAALREILEETGYRARLSRHLGVYRQFSWMPEYGLHAEKICHVYLGRVGPRAGPPSEPGHTAIWMAPREAQVRLATEGSRAMVSAWLRSGAPRL